MASKVLMIVGGALLLAACGGEGGGARPQSCDEGTPCTDPERPFCDVGGLYGPAGACVPDPGVTCGGSAECPAEAPICDMDCRTCETDAECMARDPGTPWCADSGTCVACRESSHCDDGLVCDVEANECGPCSANIECPSLICDQDTNRCVAEADIVYVDGQDGVDGPSCGALSGPCKTLGEGGAIAKVGGSRHWILVSGTTAVGFGETEVARVDIVGDPRAMPVTITHPGGGGAALAIRGSGHMTAEYARVSGGDTGYGIGCFGSFSPEPVFPTAELREVSVVASSIGVYAIGCHLVVERSSVTESRAGLFQDRGTLRARNNLIYENLGDAAVYLYDLVESESVFAFNTVVDNEGSSASRNEPGTAGVFCTEMDEPLVAVGNIVYGNDDGFDGDEDTDNPEDEVGGFCAWQYSIIEGDAPGPGNLDVDPGFVNPSFDDYHLQASSPAVDAAMVTSDLELDMDGDPRPSGAAFDIGADEVVQ